MPVVIPACSPAGRDLLCNNVSQAQYFRPVTPMRKLDLNKKAYPFTVIQNCVRFIKTATVRRNTGRFIESLFRILCKYLFSEVAVQAVTELDNKAAHCHTPVPQWHRPFL